MKWFLCVSLFIFPATQAMSQQLPVQVPQLVQYSAREHALLNDSSAAGNPFYYRGTIHYLQPLYQYLNTGRRDSAGSKDMDDYVGATEALSRHFAFAGDHASAANYAIRAYDSMPAAGYLDARNYIDTMRTVQFRDAREYILARARNEKVVMINESHHQPVHRAFTLSMLDEFYKLGFRYLALEMLNNRPDKSLTEINIRTGYHAAEPVAAELLRKARDLGFRLVPYEDTLAHEHTGSGRDAIQAAHLSRIFRSDPEAKLLVLAGHAHISEKRIGETYIPMAATFRQLTGIDPFTIDQTELTEGSNFEYGRYFYELLAQKYKQTEAVIAFRKNMPVSLLENDLYDVQLIHPPVKWTHNRPVWLNLGGARKEVPVRPTEKQLFLVQAYYASEATDKNFNILVPADQTYITDSDGYYWLFLQPGKYRLVFRDIGYRVLADKELEVNR
ncbi:carboxypeptidase-like regulatory domain-containing protein [Flavihumibacter stibioxidans]|uniref:Erythromycin esterase n=1 Tax=Flavihumibacter stibioxidans TaxID=1834163 RepID=A0ABR7M3A5_9BACT|nr:carboxypeptidase-like regulatory domain-containing protein [Flavihumibacter stibioxidans]MBC6489499.1 hypothetical protein [Flavihumibacter stibioxidans]